VIKFRAKTLQLRAFDLLLLLVGVGIVCLASKFPANAETFKFVGGGVCGLALPQIGKWWGTPLDEDTTTTTTSTTTSVSAPPEGGTK